MHLLRVWCLPFMPYKPSFRQCGDPCPTSHGMGQEPGHVLGEPMGSETLSKIEVLMYLATLNWTCLGGVMTIVAGL